MLSFWISAALLTTLAVLALVRPLLRTARDGTPELSGRSAADIAVYRDQIAEVEADRARGLISDVEAEAARIEIARRLLASADRERADQGSADRDGGERVAGNAEQTAAQPIRPKTSDTAQRLFMVVGVAVPAVALGLYAVLGSPTLPGRPVAERLAKAPSADAAIEELVARVEAQLRKNPGDGQGWDVIAPVYLRLERFADAAEAFRRALEIMGESPRRLNGLAEASVLANDGIVTEVARRAYVRLLELEPERTEARFGLALAKEQDGDLDGAEKAYRELAAKAPPNAPWRVFVIERLEAIAQKRGPGGGAGALPPPDAAAAEAVAGLPETQRRQMILQMVEGLAARLEADGRDLDGWQRLMRSWLVLGDKAKAQAALAQARKALAGDDKALSAIDAFARDLGLGS
jgi:cytochrome c-type biogenesis protein CcmH